MNRRFIAMYDWNLFLVAFAIKNYLKQNVQKNKSSVNSVFIEMSQAQYFKEKFTKHLIWILVEN